MKISVIYGTDTGTTRTVAKTIARKLPKASLRHITDASREDFESSEFLILGSPTYCLGELPDDWTKALPLLSAVDMTAKRVALFGTGDQLNYPDSFVDAMGILYDAVTAHGADVTGPTEAIGYQFNKSEALRNGKFVGLALDLDNQANKTEARIESWIQQII
ncbi:flavodoxin FldA [Telmatospirillum siberiense]|uniref:Flavodoxin n=1 Tax=Telmatospirillum siberiense TaxID=382514 RepID=A0A2N3PXM2_9PROT|nr:flavodoxin FldA [Telmatospirillum siberiense]PKU25160.1 flavodoxin FldA [Telmatospirillum siberiense]